MCDSTGLNMEDLVDVKTGGGRQEPKIEEFKSKLIRLQQVKADLQEEILEKKLLRECLQKEFAALETEAYQLELTHQENKNLMQKLQFQCEESERRSLRMKFENQLVQLIGQHKLLYSTIKESQEKN
ncbi:synaptonemal complex central element protein 1-like isoform X2 [Corythoichthys intestinalis]|uniref:synaptonemal complex central element protein 1-like isoform X2 n=1 Tax=Corythoichthys intestinalis TaxID=161448 RepID=UPI0025A66A87|nr:synaptonemal complex central element protein 1-like isoform X2 [Corythoichthys intestinalis]